MKKAPCTILFLLLPVLIFLQVVPVKLLDTTIDSFWLVEAEKETEGESEMKQMEADEISSSLSLYFFGFDNEALPDMHQLSNLNFKYFHKPDIPPELNSFSR